MRGLVMEVKKDSLIVLTDKGEYLRIKNDGRSAIGDMVPFDVPSHQPAVFLKMPRQVIAMAASFILLCTAGLGAYGYSQPFGVVNVDINPSVALTYNWFSRVIAVEALNADAEQLLPALGNLKNQPVPEAVEEVVAAAADAGFLKQELANVIFVSVSDKNDTNRSTTLMNAIEKTLPATAGKSETVLFKGSKENYDKSRNTHDSAIPELLKKSVDNDSKNDPDTLSNKPVKDILKDQQMKRKEIMNPKQTPDSAFDKPANNDSNNATDKLKNKPNKNKEPLIHPNSITIPKPDVKSTESNDTLNPVTDDLSAPSSNPQNSDTNKDNPGRNKKPDDVNLKKNPPLPQ